MTNGRSPRRSRFETRPLFRAVALLFVLGFGIPTTEAQNAPRSQARVFPAVVVTRDRAVLSAEIPGRITALPSGVGGSFRKGDALVEFDCRYYQFNRDKIAHDADAARKRYENGAKLAQLASAGQLSVDLALIDWKKAQVELQGAELMVERCTVRAPFDGAVIRIQPQVHETIAVGQPIIEIAGKERIEIEASLPAAFALSLSVGQDMRVRIEEIGAEFSVLVSGISPVIDPVSQMVTVRTRMKTPDERVIPGMTGVVRVDPS